MSIAQAPLDPRLAVVEQLRQRVAAMETTTARLPVPTLPVLADLVPLHAGASYSVDSATLALALAAGASEAGEWVGFAGWRDFGAEAAASLGIALERTVLVPDPGEHWLEVTAALVDVLKVVVLRPSSVIDAKSASIVESRLRTRSAVLVVWGEWPGVEARVSLDRSAWSGPDAGRGRLRQREARLVVRRGSRPVVTSDLVYDGLLEAAEDGRLEAAEDGRLEAAEVSTRGHSVSAARPPLGAARPALRATSG